VLPGVHLCTVVDRNWNGKQAALRHFLGRQDAVLDVQDSGLSYLKTSDISVGKGISVTVSIELLIKILVQ
jgi:hypothetical protein